MTLWCILCIKLFSIVSNAMSMNRNHATISMEFLHPNNMQLQQQHQQQNFFERFAKFFLSNGVCCCCCNCLFYLLLLLPALVRFFHSYLQIIRMLWRAMLSLTRCLSIFRSVFISPSPSFGSAFLISFALIQPSTHPYWSVCRLAALVQQHQHPQHHRHHFQKRCEKVGNHWPDSYYFKFSCEQCAWF